MARPRSVTLGTFLRAGSIRKGLIGGSTGWMVLGVFVWAPRLLRRLFGRRPDTAAVGPLGPGDGIEIRAHRPATRRERRAAGRG